MYAESIRAATHIPLHLLPQFLMSGTNAAYVNVQQNKTALWASEQFGLSLNVYLYICVLWGV